MYKDKYSIYHHKQSIYECKYIKYKNKYLNLVGGTGYTDPDKFDAFDSPDLNEAPVEIYDAAEEDEEEIIDELEEKVLEKEDFQGFDIDKGQKTTDFITEDLDQQIIDIGEWGEARGKKYNLQEFDADVFTTLQRPNKNKILALKTTDDFDTFTNKYGKMKNKKLFIKWGTVSKHYKGIYIDKTVLGDRSDVIPYQDRTTDNWLFYDYNMLDDDVIIFHKLRDFMTFKEIKKPFQGIAVDEYAIPPEDFVRYSDPITFDKILLIDDVKSFDKFTNKYGKIIAHKDNKYIDINWNRVNRDYDGFYIDKDNTFYKDRKNTAFFKDEKYESWIKKSKIYKGVVYLFD